MRVFCLLLACLVPVVRAAADPGALRVHGEVRDLRDGAPIAGARVHVLQPDLPWPEAAPDVLVEAVSDTAGEFHLTAPANENNEPVVIQAEAAGMAPSVVKFAPGLDDSAEARIDFALAPGIPVRGRIVDSQGHAVDGAEILLYRGGDRAALGPVRFVVPNLRLSARTDSAGRFEFSLPSPDRYSYRIDSGGRGGAGGTWNVQGPEDLRISLWPPRRAGARVAAEPAGLAGVRVVVFANHGEWSRVCSPRPDGLCELFDLPPGRIQVTAEDPDFPTAATEWLEASDGDRVVKLTLSPSSPPNAPIIPIRGRVIDAGSGQAVPAVEVVANDTLARTDRQGRFRFDRVPAGAVTIHVKYPWSHEPVELEVQAVASHAGAPADELVLRTPDFGAILSGRLRTPEGGPVSAARVDLVYGEDAYYDGMEMPDGNEHREPAAVDLDGAFGVALSSQECWAQVVAFHPVYGWAMSPPFRVNGARLPEPFELVFSGEIHRHGRLVNAEGKPIAAAEITATPLRSFFRPRSWLGCEKNELPRTATDENGGFLLRGIPPGATAIRMRMRSPGRNEIARLFWAVPGPAAPAIELRLDPPRSIRGRIVDARGQPLRVRVSAQDRNQQEFYGEQDSGADGSFEFTGIPASSSSILIHVRRGKVDIALQPIPVDGAFHELVVGE